MRGHGSSILNGDLVPTCRDLNGFQQVGTWFQHFMQGSGSSFLEKKTGEESIKNPISIDALHA